MTDKELKALVTKVEACNVHKPAILAQIEKFTAELRKYLPISIKVDNVSVASWQALGIYTKSSEIYLAIDIEPNVKDLYKLDTTFKAVEVALMLLGASSIERSTHTIKCSFEDINYTIELASFVNSPCSDIKAFLKVVEEYAKDYSLIKNVLAIVKSFIDEEDIKNINPYLIATLLINGLVKDAINNKYYKYLDVLIKALDELTSSKRYIYTDLLSKTDRDATLLLILLQRNKIGISY